MSLANSGNASLSASVSSLRSSLSLLDSSIAILDAGIADFPRLKTVLSTKRHFELIPQPTLVAAQASLHSELAPAITSLLARVASHIAKMERREQALIAKSELQGGRLSQSGGEAAVKRKKSLERMMRAGGVSAGGAGGKGQQEMRDRLKSLKLKKERLGYAVERLGLQSQQKQRQLRMSIAAT